MTSNQINMLRHLEDQRHNYEVENETARSNRARESETYRSNVMSERLQSLNISETSRHNRYMEAIGTADALERQLHNRNMEFETNRANVAKETEINRHNTEQELQNSYQLESDRMLKESQVKLNEAQASSTGINALVNAGKAIGGLVGWLATAG